MSWSYEKTVAFIESYKKSEVLWDSRLTEYKNNGKKLYALQLLAEQYECDVPFVKSKIKNLRTMFRREHASRKAGSASVKKSKWFGYERLLFLLDVEIPRAYYSPQVKAEFIKGGEGFIEEAETSRTTSPLPVEKPEPTKNFPKSSTNGDPKEIYKNKIPNKKRKDVDEDRTEEAYMVFKERVRRDASAIYGEHVACEIRKFSPRLQAIVKHKINNVLFEAAMAKYTNTLLAQQFDFPSAHPSNTNAASTFHESIPGSPSASTDHKYYSDSSSPDDDKEESRPVTPAPPKNNEQTRNKKRVDHKLEESESNRDEKGKKKVSIPQDVLEKFSQYFS